MKLEWKKYSFGWQKETRLVLIDDDNVRRAIATVVELQINKNDPKLFYLYYALYLGEVQCSPFVSYKSMEEAKRAALQFVKEEAAKKMKELTYIINFIE